jgi:hypothetical protein
VTAPHLAIASYTTTCEGAPIQVEGTLANGDHFYFRARHRTVTLGIGTTREEACEDPQTISLRIEGFPGDEHPVSCFHNPAPLVQWMVDVRASVLDYLEGKPE